MTPDGGLLGVGEDWGLLGLKPGHHLEAEDVPHRRVSVLCVSVLRQSLYYFDV